MSADTQPTTIAAHLTLALALTETALAAPVAEAALSDLARERAPLLDAAEAEKAAGAGWGVAEAELAARILAADQALLERMWRAQVDSFAWLRERDAAFAETVPALLALHETLVPRIVGLETTESEVDESTTSVDASRVSTATAMAAAAAYAKAQFSR